MTVRAAGTAPLKSVSVIPTQSITQQSGERYADIRDGIRQVCERFPDRYWREVDRDRRYTDSFVQAVTDAGYLGSLVPAEYGGLGMGISEASVILEEINRSGGHSAPVHSQMYTIAAVLRHGSDSQKQQYLPSIAAGTLRLQAFGVTEPNAGGDSTRIQTTATRHHDGFVVNGQKVFTSRAQHSDLLLLLARTEPRNENGDRSEGLSLFLIDLRECDPSHLTIKPLETMVNHQTNELFFEENLEIPEGSLVGKQGDGLRYLLDTMNAERILIAAECTGDGRWFVDRASDYARERSVFGRALGRNQGIQFPIARAHVVTEAADLIRWKAAYRFDSGESCGSEANMAKLLAADASWKAANVAMQTLGGYGFATEYDVERKFRETRLYQSAPISTNLILSYVAEHLLGLPRSY
jgi:acyl-CoA dehydrogenase